MAIIRDILDYKGHAVTSTGPRALVLEAVAVLNERRIGALMVLGEGEEILGIVTERDVLHLLAEDPAAITTAKVADIMTTDLVCGVPEDELDYAMSVMTVNRVRHLPVLVEGRLGGLISIGDVVRELKSAHEYEVRQLRDYISGSYR